MGQVRGQEKADARTKKRTKRDEVEKGAIEERRMRKTSSRWELDAGKKEGAEDWR